jgi:hypothetical protein
MVTNDPPSRIEVVLWLLLHLAVCVGILLYAENIWFVLVAGLGALAASLLAIQGLFQCRR